MGLADDIEAERRRRQEAAQRAAEEARIRQQKAAAERATAAWYAKRPWASPYDSSPYYPPAEYREVLLEATKKIPAELWKLGILYPDPDGREVFTSNTKGTLWRRTGFYTRHVRWVGADDASWTGGGGYGPYKETSYRIGPTWEFTLLDDGRVTRLSGHVDKIKQRIIQMILDRR